MEEEDSVLLYRPGRLRDPIHWVTDEKFWRDAWTRLGKAQGDHAKALSQFVGIVDQRLEEEEALLANTGGQDDAFLDKMRQWRELLYREMIAHGNDHDLYQSMAESVSRLFPGDLEDFMEDYKAARDHLAVLKKRLDKIRKDVYKFRDEYYTGQSQLDEADINASLSTEKADLMAIQDRVRQLETHTFSNLQEYQDHLKAWDFQLAKATGLSEDLQNMTMERDVGRAQLILDALHVDVSLTYNASIDENDPLTFDDVDATAYIEEVLRRTSWEPIDNEKFLDYDEDARNGRLMYIVTKPYTRRDATELTLRVGEYVKRITPADRNGFATGQLKQQFKNRSKSKTGLFPVRHVTKMAGKDIHDVLAIRNLTAEMDLGAHIEAATSDCPPAPRLGDMVPDQIKEGERNEEVKDGKKEAGKKEKKGKKKGRSFMDRFFCWR